MSGKILFNCCFPSTTENFTKTNIHKVMHIRKLIADNFKNYLRIQSYSNLQKNRIKRFRKMEGDLKIRPNPIVTKLDSVEFKSIFSPELNSLIELFKKYNYDLRIAGGAVRDLIMCIQPKDVDFATTATPDEMKEMFTKEEIRMINTKGERHGTITPRINDKENFEITTLRIDILTDGRHADVQFTTDWQLDANRRDLTINSMFLGLDGTVYDYFYGYEDLEKRRILFVGKADTRIKEDYLRILRYFRFYGRIAQKPDCHDENTIKAISDNAEGLDMISGERIWSEMKQILNGNYALELMLKMLDCKIGQYIGLPEKTNIDEMKKIFENKKKLNQPYLGITFVTGLLNDVDDVMRLHSRLKLTAYERDVALFIIQNRDKLTQDKDLKFFKIFSMQPNAKKEFIEEILKYLGRNDIYTEFRNWKIPKFEITGIMLKDNGCPTGKNMGIVMSELKLFWATHNFEISFDDLLKIHLPNIIADCQATKFTNKKLKLGST